MYNHFYSNLLLLSPTVMQSQGSTSTQPSFDSIGSSDSLLFSDSEQAEDDTDVFLTDSSSSVIICGTSGATTKRDNESESSRSQWTCDSFMDKEEEEESCKSESVGKASHAGKTDTMGQAPKSRGDLLFAQKVSWYCGRQERWDSNVHGGERSAHCFRAKSLTETAICLLSFFLCQCAELQGFVRPLLELLNGLKKGRFDYGKHDCLCYNVCRLASGWNYSCWMQTMMEKGHFVTLMSVFLCVAICNETGQCVVWRHCL